MPSTRTKIVVAALAVVSLLCGNFQAEADVITAKPAGGGWHSTGTWVGGVVPTASDDAVLTTAVNVDSAISVHSLSVSGGGTFYVGSALTTSGDMTTSGTLTVQQGANVSIGGSLNIGAGTQYDPSCNSVSVSGNVNVSGTLKDLCGINSSLADSFGGDVTINAGGVWAMSDVTEWAVGGNVVNNGSVTVSSGGITFSGAGKSISGTAFSIPKLVVNGSLQNQFSFTNATSLSGSGTLTVGAGTTLTCNGAVTVSALDASASGCAVNYNGGAQTVKASTYNTLNLGGSNVKTFANGSTVTGNLTIASPVRAAVNAAVTVGGTTTVNSGATLSGTSSLGGTVVANGTLAPGPTIGTLTLDHAPTMNGTTTMEINHGATPKSDLLDIGSQTWSYGGTLTVNNLGTALVSGDTFQLFNGAGYGGSFATVNLPTLSTNLAWTNMLALNGTIAVYSTAPVGKPVLGISSSGTQVTLSWNTGTYPGYSLQAQTNANGLDTNIWSNVSGGDTSPFTADINQANPPVFFRLVHP